MRETTEAFGMRAIWKVLGIKWKDFTWRKLEENGIWTKESHWIDWKYNGSNPAEDTTVHKNTKINNENVPKSA